MSTADYEFGRIAPDAKPDHVAVPMPDAKWRIKPRLLSESAQCSRGVEVHKAVRGDYGSTVSLDIDGGNVTLLMSEDTARRVAAALLAAADWDPEAALLRRADEILHPDAPEEPDEDDGGEPA